MDEDLKFKSQYLEQTEQLEIQMLMLMQKFAEQHPKLFMVMYEFTIEQTKQFAKFSPNDIARLQSVGDKWVMFKLSDPSTIVALVKQLKKRSTNSYKEFLNKNTSVAG